MRQRCGDRHAHVQHDWVTEEQDIYHCEGRSYQRPRCAYNRSSNTQCLLLHRHRGDHNIPCVESFAHPGHAKVDDSGRMLRDAKGKPYECGGRVFDQT